jgi:O-antigen ligase
MQRKLGHTTEKKDQFIFWSIIILCSLTALMGGGARADIQSLMILRPVSVFFLIFGLWHLTLDHIRSHVFLFGMAAAIFLLPLFQLLPMPTFLHGMLAENVLVTEINSAAQISEASRPISLFPTGTWNAWFSLIGPLAILVLGVQLRAEQTARLLPILIIIGVAGAVLGLFQYIGPSESSLYLYRITNFGQSVGLYSNRNHHAVMLVCVLPMLAVFAATWGSSGMRRGKTNIRPVLALVLGAIIMPLILLTGSRSGLILIVFGLIGAWLCCRSPEPGIVLLNNSKQQRALLLALGLGTIVLCAATLWTAQSSAIARLAQSDASTELRYQMWVPIAGQAMQYLPFGSGLGSFVEVFQITEPDKLLTPTYANHAHNDWLEIVMTAGLLGVVLLLIAVVAWLSCAKQLLLRSSERDLVLRTGQLGCSLILILALASVGDYPLRVPYVMLVFVIATLWIANAKNTIFKTPK